jgi:hypothetical protein
MAAVRHARPCDSTLVGWANRERAFARGTEHGHFFLDGPGGEASPDVTFAFQILARSKVMT